MTPIDRYTHLKIYWKQQLEERYKEWKEAQQQLDHWSNKLVAAEIAERLANEKP